MARTTGSVARFLDHSLLTPTATRAELVEAAQIALRFQTASLCILPWFVPEASLVLRGSPVAVCTVIGFPHGSVSREAKLREAELALDGGATELDMVVNVSRWKSGDVAEVAREVAEVTSLAHSRSARVKLIFETCLLDADEKVRLCEIAAEAQVDWVKTSTGFSKGGATPEDVALLRQHSPDRVQVKASGGIRTLADVEKYLALGASRIGTSATVTICNDERGLPESGSSLAEANGPTY